MDISADQSKQVAEAEMADIDQFRPATATTVEPGSLQTTEEMREELANEASSGIKQEQQVVKEEDADMTAPEGAGTLPLAAPGAQAADAIKHEHDDLTAKMADAGDDDLIDESKPKITGADEPSSRMIQETSELEQNMAAPVNSNSAQEPPVIQTHSSADDEIAAVAKAQAGNPEAEFEYDSSAESSSDDSSSDSDDDSDDEIESMDAETLGKILMAEDGGDGNHGADHQPRTQNEVEMIFPKPELDITPDMQITPLGKIESFVGNLAVIVANRSAVDEVMELETILCNDQREVIGVIQDTLGKVDEPRYIVTLSPEEVKKYALQVGSNVNFVNSHSKTVFTQGLHHKGTDASNIHDEEVGEDEMDFSDDEKELEYKRKNKESKKAGRGALSRGAFNRGEHKQFEPASPPNTGDRGGRGGRGRGGRGRGRGGPIYARGAPGHDQPSGPFPSTLDYDDDQSSVTAGSMRTDSKPDPEDDGFYTPLKRPDNMAQLQQSGGMPSRGRDGGRGRGRGRGEGGRGRGDRQGQGRGGHNNQQQYSGASQTNTSPPWQQASGPAPAQTPYPFNFGQAQQAYPYPQPYTQQPYTQQQPQQYQQPYPYPYQQAGQQAGQQPNPQAAYQAYQYYQQQAQQQGAYPQQQAYQQYQQPPQQQQQPAQQPAQAPAADSWAQHLQNPAMAAQIAQFLQNMPQQQQQQGKPQ